MAITLRQIASQIHRLESGGDLSNDSQFDDGYTIMLARMAANTLLKPKIYANLSEDDRGSLPMLIATYTLPVKGDGKHKYITLPEFFQSLPFNRGLKGIAPVEEPTYQFIPRNTPEVSHNLPCADAEMQGTFYQEGMNVIFDKEIEFGFVLAKLLVVAPDSIGPDDFLPLPPEDQISIIQIVREMYRNKVPQDKTLNGNPNN